MDKYKIGDYVRIRGHFLPSLLDPVEKVNPLHVVVTITGHKTYLVHPVGIGNPCEFPSEIREEQLMLAYSPEGDDK